MSGKRIVIPTLGLFVGAALLLPLVHTVFLRPPAWPEDAFTPLLQLDLQRLAQQGRRSYPLVLKDKPDPRKVASTDSYILVAAENHHQLACWESLGITMVVKVGEREIPVKDAVGGLYMWNFPCRPIGVWFRVEPSERSLQITLTVPPARPLPQAELLLLPYWDGNVKDRIVGSMIDDLITRLSWWTTPTAIGLITGSLYWLSKARNPGRIALDSTNASPNKGRHVIF